jgi:calcineurin-like phosphoesterase family protein
MLFKSTIKNAAWSTDTHFDLTTKKRIEKFYEEIKNEKVDSLFITGDIAESDSVCFHLENLSKNLEEVEIFFILGNHDYYKSSISRVNKDIEILCQNHQNLHWFSKIDYVSVNKEVCLVGNENWWDGQFEAKVGLLDSFIMSQDYTTIEELKPDNINYFFDKVRIQSHQCTQAILQKLTAAFKAHDTVYLLLHVPPFKNACEHFGIPMGPTWLNHFCNKTLGDKLIDFMDLRKNKSLKIICGHTHSSLSFKPSENITVKVGKSDYFRPKISKVFSF